MRISDWSSDVCSADLADMAKIAGQKPVVTKSRVSVASFKIRDGWPIGAKVTLRRAKMYERSEEHTSELQSLMRISYAVFCLKKKKMKYLQSHPFLLPFMSPTPISQLNNQINTNAPLHEQHIHQSSTLLSNTKSIY